MFSLESHRILRSNRWDPSESPSNHGIITFYFRECPMKSLSILVVLLCNMTSYTDTSFLDWRQNKEHSIVIAELKRILANTDYFKTIFNGIALNIFNKRKDNPKVVATSSFKVYFTPIKNVPIEDLRHLVASIINQTDQVAFDDFTSKDLDTFFKRIIDITKIKPKTSLLRVVDPIYNMDSDILQHAGFALKIAKIKGIIKWIKDKYQDYKVDACFDFDGLMSYRNSLVCALQAQSTIVTTRTWGKEHSINNVHTYAMDNPETTYIVIIENEDRGNIDPKEWFNTLEKMPKKIINIDKPINVTDWFSPIKSTIKDKPQGKVFIIGMTTSAAIGTGNASAQLKNQQLFQLVSSLDVSDEAIKTYVNTAFKFKSFNVDNMKIIHFKIKKTVK